MSTNSGPSHRCRVAPVAADAEGRDGQIVLTMPYVEMGQGTYTSIPMLIAEELEVDLKQVRLEHAPPNEKLYVNPLLGVQATGNSNAIRGAWEPMRQAGATARTMLVSAAAKRWSVRRVLRAYFTGFDRDAVLRSGFFFGGDLMLRRHDHSVNIAGGGRSLFKQSASNAFGHQQVQRFPQCPWPE
jgi:Molybdopterin-binding domain of aldehyde dehydrogenase